MKGTYQKGNWSWELELEGQSWSQGQTILGHLTLGQNGQAETAPPPSSVLRLCLGDFKSVHAKKPEAFSCQKEVELSSKSIGEKIPFSFTLDNNCAVTDKKGSYYIVYGDQQAPGHLQLEVKPTAGVYKILELLGNFHRFKLKEFKNSKNKVEYKLSPPQGRELANVDWLYLYIDQRAQEIELTFNFQVKKLDLLSPATTATKELKSITEVIPNKRFWITKEVIDQQCLLDLFTRVINQVKLNPII